MNYCSRAHLLRGHRFSAIYFLYYFKMKKKAERGVDINRSINSNFYEKYRMCQEGWDRMEILRNIVSCL